MNTHRDRDKTDPIETARAAVEWLADRIDEAGREIADHLDRAAEEISERADGVAGEFEEARTQVEDGLRRFGRAVTEFEKRTEEPTERIARAAHDIAREAQRSFERIVGKTPRSRRPFWL